MVRFLFAHHEFAQPSDKFKNVRDFVRVEFQRICRSALWRTRLFSNPFYQHGAEILGQRSVSINLEARQPLFHPDGQPIKMWQKDERGRRVGESPLSLKPDYYL